VQSVYCEVIYINMSFMKYEEMCCENKIRKLTGAKPSHTKAQVAHRAPITDPVHCLLQAGPLNISIIYVFTYEFS
jgi:hypothetical protein